jgi:uncharacterized protein
MGLLRLILLAILGALLYRSWRRWRDRRLSRSGARAGAKVHDQGRMVACRHCGLYLPQQDAVRDGDDFYCSDAHRRAGREGGGPR